MITLFSFANIIAKENIAPDFIQTFYNPNKGPFEDTLEKSKIRSILLLSTMIFFFLSKMILAF